MNTAAPEKSDLAFRTISEAAETIGVPQHVLRFWETRFPQLQPLKRGGNRRYYRPADMALLETIRAMLHDQGLTIRGARQQLDGLESKPRKAANASAPPKTEAVAVAQSVGAGERAIDRAVVRSIRDRLRAALAA